LPIYNDVEYTLIRSRRRKTASIYIERDGSVTVRVPDNLSDDEIEPARRANRQIAHPPACKASRSSWQRTSCSGMGGL